MGYGVQSVSQCVRGCKEDARQPAKPPNAAAAVPLWTLLPEEKHRVGD